MLVKALQKETTNSDRRDRLADLDNVERFVVEVWENNGG